MVSKAAGLQVHATTPGTTKKHKKKLETSIISHVIDSIISHDEFVLINNAVKKYKEVEDLVKFIEDFNLFITQWHSIA